MALRIARRTTRRHIGRSLLVAILVGIPVAGATVVSIVYHTLGHEELFVREHMGDADAIIEVTGHTTLPADFYPSPGLGPQPDSEVTRDPADVDVSGMLPDGTRLTPATVTAWDAWVGRDETHVRAMLTVAAMDEPLLDHEVRLDQGSWPDARGEVLISRPLADRLSLLDGGELVDGATLDLQDGPTVTVTGLLVDPYNLNAEQLVAAPGSLVAEQLAAGDTASGFSITSAYQNSVSYLAELPSGTDVGELWPVLADQGVRMVPRAAMIDPDLYSPGGEVPGGQVDLAAAGLTALVVGLGLFEVVLLAGAAFAVGARRQVHDLGLMATTGATATHIRRVVLAQGLVLGAGGAALGLIVGALVSVLAKPIWQRVSGTLIETWRFGTAELAIAATVGVLSGLAAAIVPAIGAARMKPVDALAERFRATRMTTRLPVLGVALTVVGAGGALVASRLAASQLDGYSQRLVEAQGTGQYINQPDVASYVALQLLGAAVAIAGVVLVIPGLVTALGRAARRLPLTGRLALRDAARHRHRTAPTVAAITIVVAGSTGLAFGLQGADRVDELQYTPSLPADMMAVSVDTWSMDVDTATDTLERATQAAVEQLPGTPTVHPATKVATPMETELGGEVEVLWIHSTTCEECTGTDQVSTSLWVGDSHGVRLAPAADAVDVRAAVDRSEVVVFNDAYVTDGHVTIWLWDRETGTDEEVKLPAHVADRTGAIHRELPEALVPPEVVAEQGWTTVTDATILAYDGATEEQVDEALHAAELAGAFSNVESGRSSDSSLIGLALAAGSAFITLVGVSVAVALSAVEGRADLATLAAVGAPPRRRRLLAGGQAVVIGGLGTILGVVLGGYFAYLVWPAIGAPSFLVPWSNVALTGVGVPLLAVVVAMVFTPSRLPMVRRIE